MPENGQNIIISKVDECDLSFDESDQMAADIANAKVILNDSENRLIVVETDVAIIQAEVEEG